MDPLKTMFGGSNLSGEWTDKQNVGDTYDGILFHVLKHDEICKQYAKWARHKKGQILYDFTYMELGITTVVKFIDMESRPGAKERGEGVFFNGVSV